MRLELDEDGIVNPWKQEYTKRYPSPKDKIRVRHDRRMIRHAPIDEEEVYLVNAIAKYKGNYLARDKYY
jgi:hypothetical protein